MRPVLCNTLDSGGGAAIASRRLHLGLRQLGDDSIYAVMQKSGDATSCIALSNRLRRAIQPFIRQIERLPLLFHTSRDRKILFSPTWRPSLIHRNIIALRPDVVHLHWIADSFIPLYSLAKLTVPIIWTLHDTWALTGGCHILKGCTRYQDGCGHCPQLASVISKDLSAWEYSLRKAAYKHPRMTIIAPSSHLERIAKSSPLLNRFPIVRIPNGIDTEQFRPIEQRLARQILQLPQNVSLLMFGAVHPGLDPNKGFDLLCNVLRELPEALRANTYCAVFGGAINGDLFPLPSIELGQLHDDVSLALAYSAADIFICPSREENLPNTIMESLACGTPVAAFHTGGIPDMITDDENGILAPPYDVKALADGIARILQTPVEQKKQLQNVARKKAIDEYALPIVAQKHHDLYMKLKIEMR